MEMDRLDQLRDMIAAEQWDQAQDLYQQLQGVTPRTARLLLMGSHIAYYGQQDLFLARRLAEQALESLGESDPGPLLGKVRFHLGIVTRELGDTSVSLEQFQRFLTELPDLYPELHMAEANAQFHLALTRRQRGELEEALAAYDQAIAFAQRDELPTLLCESLHNKAWLLCILARPSEARACLDLSDSMLIAPHLRIHQTLGEAYLAALEGNYVHSLDLCQTIFVRAEQHDSYIQAEEQAQAAWIAGTVALAQANLDSAIALADAAISYATQARRSRIILDASNLRREVIMRQRTGA